MNDALATADRAAERHHMIEVQLRNRGIEDERVLEAMQAVPRHRFVPRERSHEAYDDAALALDQGQSISQPYMVARTTELAQVAAGERVLDIGTGSGYQAAVLAALGAHVVSIERIPELAERARHTLSALGLDVQVVCGDGTRGYAAGAPYDAIVVAAGAPSVPDALLEQLATDGRLVIPVGPSAMQELTVFRKLASGATERVAYDPCRYVPLRGSGGWADGEA
jgi:protein-L-isoaspartate(D-aspartate) O-methyltransferase